MKCLNSRDMMRLGIVELYGNALETFRLRLFRFLLQDEVFETLNYNRGDAFGSRQFSCAVPGGFVLVSDVDCLVHMRIAHSTRIASINAREILRSPLCSQTEPASIFWPLTIPKSVV